MDEATEICPNGHLAILHLEGLAIVCDAGEVFAFAADGVTLEPVTSSHPQAVAAIVTHAVNASEALADLQEQAAAPLAD